MFNKGFLNGRLVSDIRKGTDGKYGFITLAVQKNYKNKEGKYDTDYIDTIVSGEKPVAAWEKYFHKGDGVIVSYEVNAHSFNRAKCMEAIKKILSDEKVSVNDDVLKKICNAAHPSSNDLTLRCGFPEFGTVGKKFSESAAAKDGTGTEATASGNVSQAGDEFNVGEDDDELPF